MSQASVERVIGMLATDEARRRGFLADPQGTIERLVEGGLELTSCERRALADLDPDQLATFAASLDARLQKCDLMGETS